MVLEEILDIQKVGVVEGVAVADEEHVPVLQDHHVALVENIYESAICKLRLYYKVRKI